MNGCVQWETVLLCYLSIPSELCPEADPTEEKAQLHVYLSSRNRCKFVVVPASTLLRRQLFEQIVAICRAQFRSGLLAVRGMFHVLHV